MKQKRAERIMEALKEMGLTQMLIVDPMSIYYLTGVYVEPFERFYALYLREDGNHVYFLNKLFTVPEEGLVFGYRPGGGDRGRLSG